MIFISRDLSWTFGELEAVLASVHSIDPVKRTAFQSRLKNFHRLGYPRGFTGVKGRAAHYSSLQLIDMALAMEMTQLGIPPERSSMMLSQNRWPILMATELVARELHANPKAWDKESGLSQDALSMFLYFDPAALRPLMVEAETRDDRETAEQTKSRFYMGTGTESEGIAGWATSGSTRMSIINLTAMAASVAESLFEQHTQNKGNKRREFFRSLETEAAHGRTKQ